MIDSTTKRCPKCGRDLPHSEFHKNRKRYDGLSSWCKSCFAVLDKQRNAVRRPKKERPQRETAEQRYERRRTAQAERQAAYAAERDRLRGALTKACKRCGQEKPKADYTEDDRYADGRYPWCAECRREWRQGRKDRQRELERKWREQNREHVREQGRNHYARHKDKIIPRRRAYDRARWHGSAEFRSRKRDEDRERYRNNPLTRERKRASGMRYYFRIRFTPEFRRKRNERSRVDKDRRRAYLAATESTLTHAEWATILREQDHRCASCHRRFDVFLRPTLDHIIPVSKGGGTIKDNVQALCQSCNSRKHTKIIDYRSLKQSSFLDEDD